MKTLECRGKTCFWSVDNPAQPTWFNIYVNIAMTV